MRTALEAIQILKETELSAFTHAAGSDLSLHYVVTATQEKNRAIVDAALELAKLNKSLARTLSEMRKMVSPYHPYASIIGTIPDSEGIRPSPVRPSGESPPPKKTMITEHRCRYSAIIPS